MQVEKIVEELKGVNIVLESVIVRLRTIQHKRLQAMVTQQDLDEARTIKEVIADLESVA